MYFYRCTFMLFFVQILFAFSNGQASKNFFRKDYKFLESTQAFYKIHTLHKSWQDAKRTCFMEGAGLFYAQDNVEFEAVLQYWNNTQHYSWIYVGISDLVAKGIFETIDGVPVMDVYNNWATGEPNDSNGIEDCVAVKKDDGLMNDLSCNNKLPFICKKTLASLTWNTECDVPYKGYVYNTQFGRCYKFGSTPMNWTDAYAWCSTEQSYLAIVNSKDEANYLVSFTVNARKNPVDNKLLPGVVFLGFHNRNKDGWMSVRGKSLEDSGYAIWDKDQPDSMVKNVNEFCGAMSYNGLLQDVNCGQKAYYICEHEVKSTVNERFGDDPVLLIH